MGFIDVKWNNVHKEVIRRLDVNGTGWVPLPSWSSHFSSCGTIHPLYGVNLQTR